MTSERLAKVFGWYDNEWGYSCRLVDLVGAAALMARAKPDAFGSRSNACRASSWSSSSRRCC